MVKKKLIEGEESVPITFVCPISLKEKIIQLASKEKRSMSQEIRFLLERAVDQREKELH
jgi:hypothetical protein